MGTTAPVVPPSPNSALIGSMSTLLMIGGVLLVICALPPVRAAVAAMFDRMANIGRKPVPAAPTPTDAQATSDDDSERRREIEEFDLDFFAGS